MCAKRRIDRLLFPRPVPHNGTGLFYLFFQKCAGFGSEPVSGNGGGFNRSMQHQIDANLQRTQEPKSFNSNKNTALSRFASTVAGSPGEVLSDQTIRRCCVDPLNRQRQSGVDPLSVIKSTFKRGAAERAGVYESVELGFPDWRNSHDWWRVSLRSLGMAQL
jgi:hypothetical protein